MVALPIGMAVRTATSSSFDQSSSSSRVVDVWYRFVVFAALYAVLAGRSAADALEPSRCAPKVTKKKKPKNENFVIIIIIIFVYQTSFYYIYMFTPSLVRRLPRRGFCSNGARRSFSFRNFVFSPPTVQNARIRSKRGFVIIVRAKCSAVCHGT